MLSYLLDATDSSLRAGLAGRERGGVGRGSRAAFGWRTSRTLPYAPARVFVWFGSALISGPPRAWAVACWGVCEDLAKVEVSQRATERERAECGPSTNLSTPSHWTVAGRRPLAQAQPPGSRF